MINTSRDAQVRPHVCWWVQVVSMLAQHRAATKALAAAAATQPQALQLLSEEAEMLAGLAPAAMAKSEPVTPVNAKLRTKLFRPPKTLKSFFGAASAASNASKSEGGCAHGASVAAPRVVVDREGVAMQASKAAGLAASMKRPALQRAKSSAGASAASGGGGVTDLSEDAPLKKKAPKLAEARRDTATAVHSTSGAVRLQECAVTAACAPAADARPAESEHAQRDVRTSSEKAAETDALKCSRKGAVAEGAAACHTGHPNSGVRHVAAGAKQPLSEKLQNGPVEKDGHRQKRLGAEQAVKQPIDRDAGDLEAVIAMGFDRTQSRIALRICGGNANRAVEFLLNR